MNPIGQYQFIFSDEPKYRIRRHVAFWLFWFLFFAFLYSYVPGHYFLPDVERFPVSLINSFFFLGAHIFLSYSLMYFVAPRLLLKGKYVAAAIATVCCFFITAFISTITGNYILPFVWSFLFDKHVGPANPTVFLSLLAGLRGGITVGGIAVAIKLMKYWYIKEQTNLRLQKEKTEAQLQLLKAQVHPHFLFNTLNNLYSLTLSQSTNAPKVVTHLSDLLRYMLYECNADEMPLDKEVEMMKKYVELEKIRYGNRIDVSFVCTGTVSELQIAALLLLPFIENSFKYGISEELDQCWINLHLHADGNKLTFNLSNSHTNNENENNQAGGIGLQNIKKRLELMYPDKYDLQINSTEEIYNVKLAVYLNRINKTQMRKTITMSTPSLNSKMPA